MERNNDVALDRVYGVSITLNRILHADRSGLPVNCQKLMHDLDGKVVGASLLTFPGPGNVQHFD